MSKKSPARPGIRVLRPAEAKAQLHQLDVRPSLARFGGVPTSDSAAGEGAGSSGELWLYGVVGGWWRGFDAEGVADALRGMDVDALTVRIHSPGGDAADGIAIGNLLRNHRAKVTVVVDGLAASAASVIAVAGDDIVMCPGSQMMLHDASTYAYGNAAKIREAADWIDGQSQNYAGVYAYKAGGTPDSWRTVMLANNGSGTWYTAEQAVAANLATEVGTRVAIGSPPVDNDDELDDDEIFARALHDLELFEQCVHPAAAAAWSGRTPKPPTASAGGSITTQGTETAVTFTDQQLTTMRDKLGLPETADEAAILAAVEAVVDESLEERPANAGVVPEGHVVVPEVRLQDLEQAAQQGVHAAKKLHDQDREAFLDANKSKFPATSRAKWGERFDKDPAGTRELLAAAADLVPSVELGHEIDADSPDKPTTLASVREAEGYQNWRM